MNPKKLSWQIFPTFVLVSFIAMLVLSALISRHYVRLFDHHTVQELSDRARILEPDLAQMITKGQWVRLNTMADRLALGNDVRVTLISTTGEFLSGSLGNLSTVEDLGQDAEVLAALKGETAVVQRFDYTTQKEMFYVAQPVHQGAKIVGVVRLGLPLNGYRETLSWTSLPLLTLVLFLSLAAALAGLWAVIRQFGPLREIQMAAESFSCGDLNGRLPGFSIEEFDQIAKSLNRMAGQLNERFDTITRQKAEQEAIFEGISEGLMVLDETGLVTNLNPAAIRILGLPEVLSKRLTELIRHPDLEAFVWRALSGEEIVSEQFELFQTEQIIQATAGPLVDFQGQKIGVLLTFYDMTHQLRLENIRKEFVANVSHELKTPITSIKGFVETLLDGAKDDPDAYDRFLGIVLKQANRLEMIVEDLLSLARIEQAGFGHQLNRERSDLRDLCLSALETCQHKADAKDIEVKVQLGGPVWAEVNPTLVEQVLLNLIDNAIKYSPEDSQVDVLVSGDEDQAVIEVIDQGIGISTEVQSRIFERFYRVDKARSGKDSSTGLGLAIVKNVVKLHQGKIEVTSTPGQGSRFVVSFSGSL